MNEKKKKRSRRKIKKEREHIRESERKIKSEKKKGRWREKDNLHFARYFHKEYAIQSSEHKQPFVQDQSVWLVCEYTFVHKSDTSFDLV